MTSEFIHEVFLQAVATAAPEKKNKWENQPFEKMRQLQIDRRGYVGEHMLVALLKTSGRKVVYTEGQMAEEKDWDVVANGFKYEIKTATIGATNEKFQHENIYHYHGWDGIVFVDIAPAEIYISCWASHTINWDDLHLRKNEAFYKWDTSLKPNHKFCVVNNRVRTVEDFERVFRPMEQAIEERYKK